MAEDEVMTMHEKIVHFQSLTGINDPGICAEILAHNDWDLPRAFSSLSSSDPQPSSFVGKLAYLPFHALSGAVGLAAWVTTGALSVLRGSAISCRLLPPPIEAADTEFVDNFEMAWGGDTEGSPSINFVSESFREALEMSRRRFVPTFVYLHSPNHPDTPLFCIGCLGLEVVAEFVNENFVAWGRSIRETEGLEVRNLLGASRFPFCAVVMAAAGGQMVILRQIEGAKSPEEILSILQQVLEETSPVLTQARMKAEERMANARLREEQDAAYQAALEADRVRESQIKEELDRLEKEAAEADRRCREQKQVHERAVIEAAEKDLAFAKRQQEKAMSLRAEPNKGTNVTEVLFRFPSGERKDRRFHSSSTVKCLFDFVDSLDCLRAEKYKLVSNFPRIIFGPDKHTLSLKEAGLHPQASLFIQPEQ